MITFGIICWFTAFICFSYIGIELWGEYEQNEILDYKNKSRLDNIMYWFDRRDKMLEEIGINFDEYRKGLSRR